MLNSFNFFYYLLCNNNHQSISGHCMGSGFDCFETLFITICTCTDIFYILLIFFKTYLLDFINLK